MYKSMSKCPKKKFANLLCHTSCNANNAILHPVDKRNDTNPGRGSNLMGIAEEKSVLVSENISSLTHKRL